MSVQIAHAAIPDDLTTIQLLFREYQLSLNFDLCFQNFEQELARLPGKYAEPHGCILLATVDGTPAGCVAIRPLEDRVCEMKRLYVRPAARGTGVGGALARRIIDEARTRGYAAMRLDTVPTLMGSAVALYRALGFVNIPRYCENPIPGAEFMELRFTS